MLQYLSQEDQKWVQETLQKVTEKMKVVRARAAAESVSLDGRGV